MITIVDDNDSCLGIPGRDGKQVSLRVWTLIEGVVAGNAVWTNSEVGLGGIGEAVPWLIIGMSNGISGG